MNRIEFDEFSSSGSIQFNNQGISDRQTGLIFDIRLEEKGNNQEPEIKFSTFFDFVKGFDEA